jgi:DNA repair exonuclease SbcCD ATPase subunit
MQQLNTQLNGLQEDKKAFDAQTKNTADLQAVSSFLSYDNGPQKFLEVFFQDTLNQTNLLISEMGLPVTLQMGNALEIMVQDNQKRVSSSLALGGGYANLIGIAFRIALQKMVLPRVNTVILDEPSTHVDEAEHGITDTHFSNGSRRISTPTAYRNASSLTTTPRGATRPWA